jgi:hypothetical protein
MTAKKTKKTKIERTLAVIDLETDPFEFGAEILPFACGLYIDGHGYFDFWGDQCVVRALALVESIEKPMVIYAHNGGKFDFYFFLEHLENPLKIINGRVVKAKFGIHEFRDSFSIIPVALAKFGGKLSIDYQKMKRGRRDANRAEILRYLEVDCTELFRLVKAFRERFGDKLTIAGTAIKELEKLHPQEYLGPGHDQKFRPFYFGGRVEYFEQGVISGRFKVFDVNSMYPSVMRNAWHPLGREYLTIYSPALTRQGWVQGYPNRMYFCEVTGHNRGALPMRTKEGLSFTVAHGTFLTTSHELTAAIQLGLFTVESITWAMLPMRYQNFAAFVDYWNGEKIKHDKDPVQRYFAKTIVNSSYGKFGQNPENYKDYWIEVFDRIGAIEAATLRANEGYDELESSHPAYRIWRRPSTRSGAYRDVAIAASITSAARAVLMRALHAARRPVYCDTDSIIALDLDLPQHPTRLGAWKTEAQGSRIAIGGKKLYALFQGRECVKAASKGVHVAPAEIERVARGGEVVWQSDAPNFSLLHPPRYITRRVRKDGHKFVDGGKK